MQMKLDGAWKAVFPDGDEARIYLPGTLDTNRIGKLNTEKYAGKLTRLYTFEGPVTFEKEVHVDAALAGKRIFLCIERSRMVRVIINGKETGSVRPWTLNTPSVFDITALLRFGQNNLLQVISDNSYPGMPYEAIVYSTTATDETQTNWNGLLGDISLRTEEMNYISAVQVYPGKVQADIWLEADCMLGYSGGITVSSDAFVEPVMSCISVQAGQTARIHIGSAIIRKDVRKWDIGEGELYRVIASGEDMPVFETYFGIRTFGVGEDCRFSLNDHAVFLRGETNCAVFPETGHPPMTVESWRTILAAYRAYGVNCVRFHSWCPPEAAFAAADSTGMLMQPELSHWNPRNAFENDVDFEYYQRELEGTLLWLANHPSFVMLTFGNELHAGDKGHDRMDGLLARARSLDATRLYANASNAHYGKLGPDAQSDFYTAQGWDGDLLRGIATTCEAGSAKLPGHINTCYPSTQHTYDSVVKRVHQEFHQPVFSFEVGQFQVLPDFAEFDAFRGVTRAYNYEAVKARAERAGLLPRWKEYVQATGELARICYREEIEAALRTEGMGGISLLGLQDFPGQGTALVGMMDSHMRPKPYPFAAPKAFLVYFADCVALAVLPRYTYDSSEYLEGTLRFSNYTRAAVEAECGCALAENGRIIARQRLGIRRLPCGVHTAGQFRLPLKAASAPVQLELDVWVGECHNTYPVWVYAGGHMNCPPSVKVYDRLTRAVLEEVMAGGNVFLTPPATRDKFPLSIGGQFSTDFWSMGTFGYQDGGMGCLIDAKHGALAGFPTQTHSNWQWWIMSRGRPMMLKDGLADIRPIVEVVDSYCRLEKMALLFEARLGGGKIMVSSMGLLENQQYPEVQALLASILAHMASDDFRPVHVIEPADLMSLLCIEDE